MADRAAFVRQQVFQRTHGSCAPRGQQVVQQRQVVAQHVEEMDVARVAAGIEARYPQPVRVCFRRFVLVRRRNRGLRRDPVRVRGRRRCHGANGGEVNHGGLVSGGLLPQRGFVAAGGQVEDLALAAVLGSGNAFQTLRQCPEARLIARGERLVQQQRQRFAALFLRLRPGQPQGQQELHAGARRQRFQPALGILPDVVGDEGSVGAKLEIEAACGHVGEYRACAAQDVRFVLGLECLLHVVEQQPRRLGQQRLLPPVLQGLPRTLGRGPGRFQSAILAGLLQARHDGLPLLDAPGVLIRPAGCGVVIRLELARACRRRLGRSDRLVPPNPRGPAVRPLRFRRARAWPPSSPATGPAAP